MSESTQPWRTICLTTRGPSAFQTPQAPRTSNFLLVPGISWRTIRTPWADRPPFNFLWQAKPQCFLPELLLAGEPSVR
jgi:hypothetical protein